MENNLATELMKELKASSKRWFVAFCVMVCLECGTIGGFMWYLSLPVDESSSIEQSVDDIKDSDITQVGGDLDGKGTTDNNN